MERVLVWDLPIRLIHGALAALFGVSFALATVAGETGAAFGLHAVLGTLAVFVVVLHLPWGLVGSRTARLLPGTAPRREASPLRSSARG